VFKDVARQFLEHLKETVLQFYGNDPQQSPDYGRIVGGDFIGLPGRSRPG
jgi:hypothetical protein